MEGMSGGMTSNLDGDILEPLMTVMNVGQFGHVDDTCRTLKDITSILRFNSSNLCRYHTMHPFRIRTFRPHILVFV